MHLGKFKLLLKRRIKALEIGFFVVANCAITFFADVLEPIGPLVALFAWFALGLLALAMLWGYALLGGVSESELADPAQPADAMLRRKLDWTGDAFLFFSVGVVLLGGVWVLQQFAPPAAAGGTAGTQGAFASLFPAVNRMQQSLLGVESKLDRISEQMESVKRETSDDPRKELANLGVPWSGENFLNAVREGDERLARLFLEGGMQPVTAQSQGRPLPVMLALNETNPGAMLDLLVESGLDVNQRFELAGALGPQDTTLLGRAIEKGNGALLDALIARDVDMNREVVTFGQMGIPRKTYPLASAIYWKRFEIAERLLDAGADARVGDYAAYREVSALLENRAMRDERERLERLRERVAPSAGERARADAELRLGQIDRELTQAALESLRSPWDSTRKRELDARYEGLQRERARLRATLGLDPTER